MLIFKSKGRKGLKKSNIGGRIRNKINYGGEGLFGRFFCIVQCTKLRKTRGEGVGKKGHRGGGGSEKKSASGEGGLDLKHPDPPTQSLFAFKLRGSLGVKFGPK